MEKRHNHSWHRRGFTLLWDTQTLAELLPPNDAISMRELFAMKNHWPDGYLPAANGDALVVAGFDGLLDLLNGDDAQTWLSRDFHDLMLSFQDFYEGQAGLILWLPTGHKRIFMNEATEEYFWEHKGSGSNGLPIGRLLFLGAECEVARLMNTDDPSVDVDSEHWIGLYHPRIS